MHLIPFFLDILTGLSFVVGFLLPVIIRVLNKDIVDDDERLIMTYLICFVAAMIIDYKSLQSGDVLTVLKWFTAISIEAQASFKLYFSPKWSKQAVNNSVA